MIIVLFLIIMFLVFSFIDNYYYCKEHDKYLELKKKFEDLKFEHFKLISDGVVNDKELQKYKDKYNNLVKEYVDVRAKNVELQVKLLNKKDS